MIYIDRSIVPSPKILQTAGETEVKLANEFYANNEETPRQNIFDFETYRHETVRNSLSKLFHQKCAYCETSISSSQYGNVEHFRPIHGVIDNNGTYLPQYYYWLANEWSNLYLACAHCNPKSKHILKENSHSSKGARFPLEDESLRVVKMTRGSDLYEERPLLIDPCHDHPEDHFIYENNGLVISETLRGRTTIDILDLNRKSLVEARKVAAQQTIGILRQYRNKSVVKTSAATINLINEMISPSREYSAVHRSIIARSPAYDSHFEDFIDLLPSEKRRSDADVRKAKISYDQYIKDQTEFSLDSNSKSSRTRYFSKSRRIQRIEIVNIKSISKLSLDLNENAPDQSWTMLLGENGTGKSTILQAITLALSGARHFYKLVLKNKIDLSGFIRSGCKTGTIKIYLDNNIRALRIMNDRVEFTSSSGSKVTLYNNRPPTREDISAWGVQTLLLSYGATRLLPNRPKAFKNSKSKRLFVKSDNLFDPFVPLNDAQSWLLSLSNEEFNYAARALKSLLNLENEGNLVRRENGVLLHRDRLYTPIERLSDGYKSVIALTLDILSVAMNLWESPELAEGVVLLDEIDAHMHPRWKMQIVSALKKTLPRLQFIATTHDPLCLRGLSTGEVIVMKRDIKGRSVPITDLPSIEGLRADQLLTSEYFGLHTTVEPSYQRLFDEYYSLRCKVNPTNKDKKRTIVLRTEIDALGMLGNTRRERLLLDAIDLYLAKEAVELGSSTEQKKELDLSLILEGLKNS